MKKIFSSVAALSIVVLVGAGCSPTPQTPPPAAQNQDQVSTPPTAENGAMTEGQTKPAGSELKLTAEAEGRNMVTFRWELPSGMTEPSVFRLVRDAKPDPVSPGNYYYTVMGSKRSTTWISLPTGKQYFRICTYNTDEDKCDVYSNGVEVDVR